jgi:hypothetical protein
VDTLALLAKIAIPHALYIPYISFLIFETTHSFYVILVMRGDMKQILSLLQQSTL